MSRIHSNNVGEHGNAWNNQAVGVNATSGILDTEGNGIIAAFGNASAATTITLQYSQNNTDYFDSSQTIVLGAAGNFGNTFTAGARFVRLKSSAAVTITATLSAKN